jgi:hypothetical protein
MTQSVCVACSVSCHKHPGHVLPGCVLCHRRIEIGLCQLKVRYHLVISSGSSGHVAGHEVWDSVSGDFSIPVIVSGAVAAGGLMALLAASAAAPQAVSANVSAQVGRSISLLVTVLLMAGWMFVNWCAVTCIPTNQSLIGVVITIEMD